VTKALGIIGVLGLVLAGWAVPVGERLTLRQDLPVLPPPPPPPAPSRPQPCSPAVPCCPTAVQQLSGPPCRVGCAPPPTKVRTASPDLSTVANPPPSGVVILELTINEKGVPVSSCVLRGIRPDFDQVAQVATLKWRFEPKLLEGKPVGVVMTVTVKAPDLNTDGRKR
jgi:TonB family protein